MCNILAALLALALPWEDPAVNSINRLPARSARRGMDKVAERHLEVPLVRCARTVRRGLRAPRL